MKKVFEKEFAGRRMTVETGQLAEQANGSCLVRCGETAVLVTATASETQREGIDFFPLMVDYEEKMYSVGKIPGGFIKREGRPSEKAVLTSRLIDRPIRPLFPKGYRNDVQVVATVLSVDPEIQPEVYAMIGSSIALSISDIPFAGPTGSVVVGCVNNELVINPTSEQTADSTLHLVVSGTRDAVMMVEAGAEFFTEEKMLEAIMYGHEHIINLIEFIDSIVAEVGKPKMEITLVSYDEKVDEEIKQDYYEKIRWSLDTFDRDERKERQNTVTQEIKDAILDDYPDMSKDIEESIYYITKDIIRENILSNGIRPDGRKLDEIRPIWCEVGVLARTHGSGIFTRGQTQVLTVATLGPISEVQKLDGIAPEIEKRYMHHYNFPPYSVGEARPMRGAGRREIGHGALAERALLPVIPSEQDFPYAIRLVSEVLSSNGSTSQASVCASTLSLMEAGVPIKNPVAGVAMGLIKDAESDKVAILTDIQGLEDFLGDMDFKVAGTKDGITAIQMDIKIKGIDRAILEKALEQARIGRLYILDRMLETISVPRTSISQYAPKIINFKINPDKIREVIGPGGKMINKIIDETGVKIDIEDDGSVYIATSDEQAAAKAKAMIDSIVKEVEVGEVYYGEVVRLMSFGAFVNLIPGKDGMVHISKLADQHVKKVEDEVNIGDKILVKVIEIDSQGRVNLSRKGLLEEEKKIKESKA